MKNDEASLSKQQLREYARDVSQIYKSEKEKRGQLEIANTKLRNLLDTLDDGVVSVKGNLDIIEANSSFCRIFQISCGDVTDANLSSVLSSGQWPTVLVGLDDLRESDQVLVNVYDDNSLLYNVARVPVLDSRGKLESIVLVFNNETEIRRAGKLKDEFLALVSHEIRTPVTSISGFAQLLESMLADRLNEDEKTFLSSIDKSSRRLVRTVDELLDVAQKSMDLREMNFERADLKKIVESSCEKIQDKLRSKNGSLELNLPSADCTVNGDAAELEKALGHVLDNAVEFSGDSVAINIDMSVDSFQSTIRISDNGPGIDPVQQESIFSMFYQVEDHISRTHEGVGLGLPIARRTLAMHDGSISMDSGLGEGTTVTLEVPLFKVNEKTDERIQENDLEQELLDFRDKEESHRLQVQAYARDFSQLFHSEKQKRQQLKKYAGDLNNTIRELKNTQAELHEAYLDTIYRMSLVAEYKDDDTAEHVERMSHYSAIIAERLNLPSETVNLIRYAAPMHDLGKVGIPDTILTKPGKLLDTEISKMREHPGIGSGILARSEANIIRMAEEIAKTHHEKWDGTGYPNGLKGEEIPIAGRIVALADVFDALTSQRPHKNPYPVDIACHFIESRSGENFDPKVVDAFMSGLDDILAVKKEINGDKDPVVSEFVPSERDRD